MKYAYVLLLLITNVVFAESIYFKNDSTVEPVCPNYVKCKVDGQMNSCVISNDPFNVWGFHFVPSGRVEKGYYKFISVESKYHYPYLGIEGTGDTSCRYSLVGKGGYEKQIVVFPNSEIISNYPVPSNRRYERYQPVLYPMTKWQLFGWNATCHSTDPSDCPLKEIPEITFDTMNRGWADRMLFVGNRHLIEKQAIQYDRLLELCGNTPLCKVTIGKCTQFVDDGCVHEDDGYALVDISEMDKVKILMLDSFSTSTCVFNKRNNFNAIYCEPRKPKYFHS